MSATRGDTPKSEFKDASSQTEGQARAGEAPIDSDHLTRD